MNRIILLIACGALGVGCDNRQSATPASAPDAMPPVSSTPPVTSTLRPAATPAPPDTSVRIPPPSETKPEQ